MLNISPNRINNEVLTENYDAFGKVINPNPARNLLYIISGILVGIAIIMFLPWTQNINARGNVTTLRPQQRPQTIESTLDGRIEKWFVNEGDTISRGDTILFISEITNKYFNPELVDRMTDQLNAKESSIKAYAGKANALQEQKDILFATLELKLQQAERKVRQSEFKVLADQGDLRAAQISDSIALVQIDRALWLNEKGLNSRADLEKKRKERQEAQAKLISQENKLSESRQALEIANIEFRNLRNEYAEKITKAESDRQSAKSNQFNSEAEVAKLANELSNIQQRIGFRYVIAPQDGIINKALKAGIGETVKKGEAVVSVVPLKIELAAEIFVRPVDLPLIRRGEPVQILFDGWPAIIFGAGWPNASFGTFKGKVYAIENDISSNGRYRLLIEEGDPVNDPWPSPLRVGAGVQAFALLNDVPVWYEIWRQLNGFPPEYYQGVDAAKEDKSSSAKGKK